MSMNSLFFPSREWPFGLYDNIILGLENCKFTPDSPSMIDRRGEGKQALKSLRHKSWRDYNRGNLQAIVRMHPEGLEVIALGCDPKHTMGSEAVGKPVLVKSQREFSEAMYVAFETSLMRLNQVEPIAAKTLEPILQRGRLQ